MIPFSKWTLRWKFPLFVVLLQVLILAVLQIFFSQSTEHGVKMLYLIVAYPFLNSLLFSSAWLMILYWIGWSLEGKAKP